MWVLAAVLLLFCLLLFSPLCLRFTLFEGNAALEVRLLFFRFSVFGEKKEKKKKREKPVRAKKGGSKRRQPKKQEKKKSPLSGPWDAERLGAAARLGKELLLSCGRAGGFLLKKARLKRLWVEIMVVRQDACQTAAQSGKLNAWFYGALSLLENYLQPEDLYVSIYPGFWAIQEKTAADVIFSFTPARLLGAGCLLLFGALRSLIRFVRPPASQAGRSPADTSEEAAGSNIQKGS
jgi:hypothetical protein